MICNFVARHPTFGSNSLIFNNHELVSAFLSAGARVLVGLWGAIVTVNSDGTLQILEAHSDVQLLFTDVKGPPVLPPATSSQVEQKAVNVDELDSVGNRVCEWCFLPEGKLAAGDIMLAQKIALETFESQAS
jgi:hypothetical protein